jgi:tRNA A37 threonylcarbamoyladenosine synthetase subunit TsaC/SUA5/YrdC
MSVSLPMDDEVEYYTDPELMYEKFDNVVDIVIDGGFGNIVASTVIDLTSGIPELIREGAGSWEKILG